MRVAIFTNKFPAPVSTFFARDVQALAQAGFTVDVFALYPLDPRAWQFVPASLDDRALPRERVHHPGWHLLRRAVCPPSTNATARLLGDGATVLASASRYGAEPVAKSVCALLEGWAWATRAPARYDHVLAYWGNYAGTAAFLFHRIAGGAAPFTIFLHAGTDLYRTPVALARKLLYADNIVVVCEFNRQYLAREFPAIFHRLAPKIHLHHLGLDLQEWAYQPDGRPARTILAVGAFERVKGFDVLLRAARRLMEAGQDLELELIGEGPESGVLHDLAAAAPLRGRVRFRGWLRPDEVRRAMLQATMLVHPSTGLGDAVPTVIKEAMALGTPVIGSAVAGIPELLDEGRCGVLVPPQDEAALAQAIAGLLDSAERRAALSRGARAYAETVFDMRHNGSALADLIRQSRRRAVAMTGRSQDLES